MNNDWKSALAALRDQAPEAPQDTETSHADSPVEAKGPGANLPAAAEGRKLNIAYERKGRGGKAATIIYGFADTASDEDIEALAATLKRRLGVGGAARGGEILLQGDWRERAAALLRDMGYKAKG